MIIQTFSRRTSREFYRVTGDSLCVGGKKANKSFCYEQITSNNPHDHEGGGEEHFETQTRPAAVRARGHF